jgi:hypothetical protein
MQEHWDVAKPDAIICAVIAIVRWKDAALITPAHGCDPRNDLGPGNGLVATLLLEGAANNLKRFRDCHSHRVSPSLLVG